MKGAFAMLHKDYLKDADSLQYQIDDITVFVEGVKVTIFIFTMILVYNLAKLGGLF